MKRSYLPLVLCVILCHSILVAAPANIKPSLSIGLTINGVVSIFGKPTGMLISDKAAGDGIFHYGNMKVTLSKGRVVAWESYPIPPRVGQLPPITYPCSITDVQDKWGIPADASFDGQFNDAGEPIGFVKWVYGKSFLLFRDGKLAGWDNLDDLPLTTAADAKGRITLGMSVDDVAKAIKAPKRLIPLTDPGSSEWIYGSSVLYFHAGILCGWNNVRRELPIDSVAAQPHAPMPTLQSTQADVIASLGTPMIAMPKDNDVAILFYPTMVIALNTKGEVVEVATKRLVDQLKKDPITSKNAAQTMGRVLEQPHLDDVKSIQAEVLNSEQQFSHFLLTIEGKDSELFHSFVRANGDTLLATADSFTDRLNGYDCFELKRGMQTALDCHGIKDIDAAIYISSLKDDFSPYYDGIEMVVDAYKKYLNPLFKIYAATRLKHIPELIGKTQNEAVATLLQEGLQSDIVRYKHPQAGGAVTDICPKAGSIVDENAVVVLYVRVE